tara:strand:+ start:32630 stop:33112 length:483 start_codon:yes stop_codon:yes gene_type:complete
MGKSKTEYVVGIELNPKLAFVDPVNPHGERLFDFDENFVYAVKKVKKVLGSKSLRRFLGNVDISESLQRNRVEFRFPSQKRNNERIMSYLHESLTKELGWIDKRKGYGVLERKKSEQQIEPVLKVLPVLGDLECVAMQSNTPTDDWKQDYKDALTAGELL